MCTYYFTSLKPAPIALYRMDNDLTAQVGKFSVSYRALWLRYTDSFFPRSSLGPTSPLAGHVSTIFLSRGYYVITFLRPELASKGMFDLVVYWLKSDFYYAQI